MVDGRGKAETEQAVGASGEDTVEQTAWGRRATGDVTTAGTKSSSIKQGTVENEG